MAPRLDAAALHRDNGANNDPELPMQPTSREGIVADNARTLVLTGASRGIGHATVKKFSASGWRVITVSRHPFSVMCPWPGGSEDHVEMDLADPVDLGRGIEQIRARINGKLDALVNNAAISPKDDKGGRLGAIDTPFDLWRQVFNVNFFAPVALARGLIDELSAARGCVVNVTSIAGSRVHPFAGSAYATSKAALAALTREMAHDFGPRGVRVNAIAPGEIDTAILSPGTEKIVEEQIPMRRLGTPEEVADVVRFLCEGGASYVSGAEIQINGGQHV
jgi:NAD(P)-dependent dehydrogenase (short-subunit alcohol dehydrogenase family)